MASISGATKQVILPPSNEPVTSQTKTQGKLANTIASLPDKEMIRHEIILANMLLTCKLDDKGQVVEDPAKKDVRFGTMNEALAFLRNHEGFKKLIDKI